MVVLEGEKGIGIIGRGYGYGIDDMVEVVLDVFFFFGLCLL